MIYVRLYHGNNENVTTTLIWGTTWENTLNFLISVENKSYNDLLNPVGWGNYADSYFSYTDTSGNTIIKSDSSLIPTGSTEYTNSCNIYDLAGNVAEWSQKSNQGGERRLGLGGFYDFSSSSIINGMTAIVNSGSNRNGARCILFIN